MSNQGKLSKYNIYNILYVALFVVISSLLLWKCRFGYATLDEAFYPTIAYRFIQGDAILSEEWNNTQLSNLILIPILKCYINTKGNLDGIYLAIRYMYTVCKILISMLIYYKLRYFGKHSAQATSLIFLIFAGYGMMVLSYNSVASAIGIAVNHHHRGQGAAAQTGHLVEGKHSVFRGLPIVDSQFLGNSGPNAF